MDKVKDTLPQAYQTFKTWLGDSTSADKNNNNHCCNSNSNSNSNQPQSKKRRLSDTDISKTELVVGSQLKVLNQSNKAISRKQLKSVLNKMKKSNDKKNSKTKQTGTKTKKRNRKQFENDSDESDNDSDGQKNNDNRKKQKKYFNYESKGNHVKLLKPVTYDMLVAASAKVSQKILEMLVAFIFVVTLGYDEVLYILNQKKFDLPQKFYDTDEWFHGQNEEIEEIWKIDTLEDVEKKWKIDKNKQMNEWHSNVVKLDGMSKVNRCEYMSRICCEICLQVLYLWVCFDLVCC